MISIDLLNKWTANRQNLIIIDVRARGVRRPPHETIPEALNVPASELPSLLRWLPPQTILVFCCQGEIHRFDGQLEKLLSQAEINTIYLLVFPMCASIPKVRMSGGELSGKATVFPLGQTGRECLQPWRQYECKN